MRTHLLPDARTCRSPFRSGPLGRVVRHDAARLDTGPVPSAAVGHGCYRRMRDSPEMARCGGVYPQLPDAISQRHGFHNIELTRLRLRPTRYVAAHTKFDTFASSLSTQAEVGRINAHNREFLFALESESLTFVQSSSLMVWQAQCATICRSARAHSVRGRDPGGWAGSDLIANRAGRRVRRPRLPLWVNGGGPAPTRERQLHPSRPTIRQLN
jgi:hypothetical protein